MTTAAQVKAYMRERAEGLENITTTEGTKRDNNFSESHCKMKQTLLVNCTVEETEGDVGSVCCGLL